MGIYEYTNTWKSMFASIYGLYVPGLVPGYLPVWDPKPSYSATMLGWCTYRGPVCLFVLRLAFTFFIITFSFRFLYPWFLSVLSLSSGVS